MLTETLPLTGRRIGITADRRWREQADLFVKRGAGVVHGPTMRTVDLSTSDELRVATEAVVVRPPNFLLATTGMGMRMWLEAAGRWRCRDQLLESLARTRILARGAKAASAVRAAGLDLWWQAPGETVGELVDHLRREPLGQATLALQLFDPVAHPATEELRDLVRTLVELPVYEWHLPLDLEPARGLIAEAVEGRVDAITFTSQPAVQQLFAIAAGRPGQAERLRRALNQSVVVSCVGPVCAAAATEMGLVKPLWPEPPRLVAMVRQLTEVLSSTSGANC